MINHACIGMIHSHAKTLFKRENAFKEDPATVQVNYISLEQYKHKGKCMQRGEENRHGGRRRSCNVVEGSLASQLVLPSVPALSPLFSARLLSFNLCNLRPSLFTGYLHFLLPCFVDFICRKGRTRKVVSASFLVSLLFFHLFFLFLFYCLPS